MASEEEFVKVNEDRSHRKRRGRGAGFQKPRDERIQGLRGTSGLKMVAYYILGIFPFLFLKVI